MRRFPRRPNCRSRHRSARRRCVAFVLVSESLCGSRRRLRQPHRDPRNPAAPLRTHTYTHSDDITAVHFQKTSPSSQKVLLSASTDCLLSLSNADEDDEDEASLHVGNWGCSIAQTGWVHGRSGTPGIWSSSDMETFGAWTGEVRPFNQTIRRKG